VDSIWDLLEWGFYCGGEWGDLINLIVRIVRDDFEGVKDVEGVEDSLLAVWLKDLGREASFNKAVRAIMATPEGEMKLDDPRPLYRMNEPSHTEATDI
jgi:hypothetical protein